MNDQEINERIDAYLRNEECIVKVEHNGKFVDCVTIRFAVEIFNMRAGDRARSYTYHAVHSAVHRRTVVAIAVGSARPRLYYSVESLKSCPLYPSVAGKPKQKTKAGYRPPPSGYSERIRNEASEFFAGRKLNAEDLERLSKFREAKEAKKSGKFPKETRIHQHPTLSNRAIADYLSMVHGRGDDTGTSGMQISYETVNSWRKEWTLEQGKSLQPA